MAPTNTFPTPGILRCCGTRDDGGLYAEVPTHPYGDPVESFFFDPPIAYDTDCHLGVQLVERETTVQTEDGPELRRVVHVLDFVGSSHYPFVADFIEEGRVHGFSRRMPKGLAVERLTRDSRLLIVHARGLITNPSELRVGQSERATPSSGTYVYAGHVPPERCACWAASHGRDWKCLTGGTDRREADTTTDADPWFDPCTRDWYADAPPNAEGLGGVPIRQLPSGAKFDVFPPYDGEPTGDTSNGERGFGRVASAIVAALPIGRLAVASVGESPSDRVASTFSRVSARNGDRPDGLDLAIVRA